MEHRHPEDRVDDDEQRQRDPVGGEVVMRLEQEIPEPGVILLIRGRKTTALAEADLAKDGKKGRDEEARPGSGESDGADARPLLLVAFREEQRNQREEQRRPDDRGEDDAHDRCTQRWPVAASTDSSARMPTTTRPPASVRENLALRTVASSVAASSTLSPTDAATGAVTCSSKSETRPAIAMSGCAASSVNRST